MLTVQDLDNMATRTIFASGSIKDSSEDVNITNSGKTLYRIACRGCVHDWAIYCSFKDLRRDDIHDYGDKIFAEENIKKLVPCDDEAFKLYRY